MSIYYHSWYDLSDDFKNINSYISNDNWLELIELREKINVELEKTRNSGKIGSALQAELVFYARGDLFDLLNKLEGELRFLFITSDAKLEKYNDQDNNSDKNTDKNTDKIQITDNCYLIIKVSEHEKCVRCWQHRESVGKSSEHSKLCDRCIENVSGSGESRLYL